MSSLSVVIVRLSRNLSLGLKIKGKALIITHMVFTIVFDKKFQSQSPIIMYSAA